MILKSEAKNANKGYDRQAGRLQSEQNNPVEQHPFTDAMQCK